MGQPLEWVGEQLFGIKKENYVPTAPPTPTPPPEPEIEVSAAEDEAKKKNQERRRMVKKYGHEGTVKTSPYGLVTEATTQKKQLLGQ
jgi:hypothetical protein